MGTQVIDNGDLRKYRTEIPNLIDDMDLSVYAFRLYVHLKRVAGDNGRCWQGKRALADACKMSASAVTRAKRELIDAGLIEIDPGNAEKSMADTITICDIWGQNFVRYSGATPGPTGTTPGPVVAHPWSHEDHPGPVAVHKKEPYKKEPMKKGGERERDKRPEPAKPQAPPPAFAEPTGDIYMDAAVNKWNRRQAGQAVHPGQFQQGEWNKQVPASERVPLLEAIADLTGKRPMWEADDVRIGNLLHEAAIKAHQWGYTPGHLRRLEEAWIADWRSGGKRAGRIDQFVEFLSEQKANGGKPAAPPPGKPSAPQSIVSDDLMAWMEKQAHEQFLASRTN